MPVWTEARAAHAVVGRRVPTAPGHRGRDRARTDSRRTQPARGAYTRGYPPLRSVRAAGDHRHRPEAEAAQRHAGLRRVRRKKQKGENAPRSPPSSFPDGRATPLRRSRSGGAGGRRREWRARLPRRAMTRAAPLPSPAPADPVCACDIPSANESVYSRMLRARLPPKVRLSSPSQITTYASPATSARRVRQAQRHEHGAVQEPAHGHGHRERHHQPVRVAARPGPRARRAAWTAPAPPPSSAPPPRSRVSTIRQRGTGLPST